MKIKYHIKASSVSTFQLLFPEFYSQTAPRGFPDSQGKNSSEFVRISYLFLTGRAIFRGNVRARRSYCGASQYPTQLILTRNSVKPKHASIRYWLGLIACITSTVSSSAQSTLPSEWNLLAAADPSKNEAVGATSGQLNVDPSGAATYSIPIAISPGSAGMEPKISLVYSSATGAGVAGYGWSISGLSAITRVSKSKAIDSSNGSLNFDANDRYALDGQRLVVINNIPDGAPGAEYRTETDGFSRIVSYGQRGSFGPSWFKAWTKSGLIVEFGRSENSVVTPLGGAGESLTWNVNKISDTKGNSISFSYIEDPAYNIGRYISRIDYTSNESQGVLPYASMRFEYESRPDKFFGYIKGRKIGTTFRLKLIKSYCGETLVRSYSLNYIQRPYTERTILSSLIESDGAGVPYPALTFEYTNPPIGWDYVNPAQWAPPVPIYAPGPARGIGFIDLNADGRQDFFQSRFWGSGGEQGAWLNRESGWEWAPQYILPYPLTVDGMGDTGARLTDLNGDGLIDEINPASTHAALNTGNGFVHSNRFTLKSEPEGVSSDYSGQDYYVSIGKLDFVDVTGDGLPDCLGHANIYINSYDYETGQSSSYLAETRPFTWQNAGPGADDSVGAGWINLPNYAPLLNRDLGAFFMDVNGDGLIDQVHHWSNGTGYYYKAVAYNTGSGWSLSQGDPLAPPEVMSAALGGDSNAPVGSLIADLNGDGIADQARHNIGPHRYANSAFINTGAGWEYNSNFLLPQPIGYDSSPRGGGLADVNNDGIVDMVYGWNYHRVAYIGTGTGWSPSDGEYNLPYPLVFDLTPSGAEFADINADGAIDQVYSRFTPASGWSREAAVNRRVNPDRLVKITNGFGVAVEISYAPLADPSVYTKGCGATYPKMDVSGTSYVVKTIDNDDGAGGRHTVRYSYGGLRLHALRGFLGFEWMQVTDDRTGIRSKTWFKQDYPFIGMATASETRTNTNLLLSESVTTYAEKLLNGGVSRFPYASESIQRSYELNGALVSESFTTAQYDDWGNATRVEVDSLDGHEKVTVSSYDNWIQAPSENSLNGWLLGRLSRSTVTASSPTAAAQTRVSSFTYNPTTGLLVTETVEPDRATDPANYTLTTTYGYDAFGNKTSAVTTGGGLGSGRSATTAYDAVGRFPVSTTNALGHTESYTYDQAKAVVLTTTGPNGLSTSWIYDGFARKIQENRADGTSTYVRYRWPGTYAPSGTKYFVETESTGSAPSLVCYDAMGRAFMSYSVNGGGVDGNARIVVQKTEFDNMGRAYRSSLPYYLNESPAGWVESANYDILGRPTLLITPNDDVSGGLAYSSVSYAGLVTTTTNAKGQVERVEKNAQGQVMRRVNNANAPPGSVERGEVTYAYDAFGQLLTTTVYKENGSTVSTSLAYDLRGRKISMVDPDMGIWSYAYNAAGELTTQTDAKGQITSMQYDPLGRLVQREERVSAGANPVVTTWAYDTASGAAIGKLHTVTISGDNANASVGNNETYSYDSLGRVNHSTRVINGQSFTLHQSFDPTGRPLVSTYPSGFQVKNVYTALGFLKEVRRADSGLNDLYWAADSYALDGRVNGEYYGNGMSVDQVYSQITGRLRLSQSGISYAATRAQDLSYTYDVLGNVQTRNDNAMSRSESFAYDGLNRLTQHTVTGGAVVSLTYDSLGNITHKSDVGNYAYDGSRRHAVVETSGGSALAGSTYSYDGNGNMLSGAGRSYTWTLANQVKRAEKGGIWSEFQFSASNQRALQTNNLGQSIYYVSGSFEEVRHSGGLIERKFYISAPTGRVAVRVERSNGAHETRWFHHDGLGSINAVSDESSNMVQRFAYDAWGKRVDGVTGSGVTNATNGGYTRGYTDHEHLEDLGLIHMNGRVFDPVLGRFLSADPFVDNLDDSQSWNRYSYVNNNPLNHTDPSGYFKKWWKKALIIVAVIVISVVTYGAASGWAYTAGTAATATSAGTAATGVLAGSVAAGTISATTAGVIAGAIGGAAAGFASGFAASLLNGGSLGDAFRSGVIGAASGVIAGGVAGYFGKTWSLTRVAATTVAGGVGSEISGRSFREGALLAGAVSLATYGAIKMREFTINQSRIDPRNAQGRSAGFNGDGFKAGGGRFDERIGAIQQESPLGGIQGGKGVIKLPLIGRIEYQPGSFLDRTVEAYSGVHDWLNNPWGYNPATGNYNPGVAIFGQHLGKAASAVSDAMNWIDVPLSTPIVGASVAGVYAPNYVQAYNQARKDD
jgi:RHS repeat-associated protein